MFFGGDTVQPITVSHKVEQWPSVWVPEPECQGSYPGSVTWAGWLRATYLDYLSFTFLLCRSGGSRGIIMNECPQSTCLEWCWNHWCPSQILYEVGHPSRSMANSSYWWPSMEACPWLTWATFLEMPGRLTSPPCLLTKPRLRLRPHLCPAFSGCFTPIQVLPECMTSVSHMHPSDGFRLCCQGAQLDPSTQHESLRLMSLFSFSRSQELPSQSSCLFHDSVLQWRLLLPVVNLAVSRMAKLFTHTLADFWAETVLATHRGSCSWSPLRACADSGGFSSLCLNAGWL